MSLDNTPPEEPQSFLQSLRGPRLLGLIAVLVMLLILLGFFAFWQFGITPQVVAREKAINQLAAVRKSALDAEKSRASIPTQLQMQLATAQAQQKEAGAVFVTEAQAAEMLKRPYVYALEANVQITDLQALTATAPSKAAVPTEAPTAAPKATAVPAAQASPSVAAKGKATAAAQPTAAPKVAATSKVAFETKRYRLQALGTVANLVNFVAKFKETVGKGVVISNVLISEGREGFLLTMDFSIYVSSYASAVVEAITPRITPTATAGPSATAVLLVRPTNWPTNWPWPPAPTVTGTLLAPPPAASTPVPPSAATAVAQPTPTGMATPGATPMGVIYVVKRGDTLSMIARRYGVTIQAIKYANGLTSDLLRVGQELKIPNK
jgi:murein DD-endopeptidase MepM/ murein hydrolase activator NlpD